MDTDDDGRLDVNDNCRLIANPGQENNDGDDQGNADTDYDGTPDIDDADPFDASRSNFESSNGGAISIWLIEEIDIFYHNRYRAENNS